jgi:hypothetical protein
MNLNEHHDDTAAQMEFSEAEIRAMYPSNPNAEMPSWANGVGSHTFEFTDCSSVTVTLPYMERPADMTDIEADVWFHTVYMPFVAPILLEAIRASFVRDLGGDPRLELTDGHA